MSTNFLRFLRVPGVALALALALAAGAACESDGGAGGDASAGADVAGPGDTADPGADLGGGSDVGAADDVAPSDDVAAADDTGGAGLAIVGTYADDWGTAHVITDDTWTQTYPGAAPYVFHVTQYANDEGWLVAQNDGANEFSGGLWSRFDWVWSGAELYYCQSAYDAASEEAAAAAAAADASDPAGAGCGPGPWTRLVAAPAS